METKLRSLGLNDFNFQPDLPLGFLDVEVTRTSLDTNKWVLAPVGQECLQRAWCPMMLVLVRFPCGVQGGFPLLCTTIHGVAPSLPLSFPVPFSLPPFSACVVQVR
jgi:hypothetical protein